MFERSFLLSALAVSLFSGCAQDPGTDGDVAEVRLEVATTPPTVRCLVVSAVATGRTVQYPVTVNGGSAPLSLTAVPVGRVRFEASAYDVACGDGGAPADAQATWVAASVTTDVLPGRVNPLALVLHPTSGDVGGTVDFQTPVVQVVLGPRNGYAILANGELWDWGDNTKGQLGDGTTTTRRTPKRVVALSGVESVAAGPQHACAILGVDHSVWCWGENQGGRLGTGDQAPHRTPTQVFFAGGVPLRATKLALGEEHSCALTTDKTMTCWGDAAGTQMTDKMQLVPVAPQASPFEGIVDIAAAADSHCILVGTGKAKCWLLVRENLDMFPVSDAASEEGPGAIVGMEMRPGGRIGVRANGEVYTWTRATNTNAPAPILIGGITDAIQASGAGTHACAVRTGGTVRCFGKNTRGQLGTGTTDESTTAVNVLGLTDIVQVATGGYIETGPLSGHSCAINESGALFCWGSGLGYATGLGDQASRFVPERVRFVAP
jgi:alpha-tubulin suppressor-like RCC1 family protein